MIDVSTHIREKNKRYKRNMYDKPNSINNIKAIVFNSSKKISAFTIIRGHKQNVINLIIPQASIKLVEKIFNGSEFVRQPSIEYVINYSSDEYRFID